MSFDVIKFDSPRKSHKVRVPKFFTYLCERKILMLSVRFFFSFAVSPVSRGFFEVSFSIQMLYGKIVFDFKNYFN